jgi:hypothetical protein
MLGEAGALAVDMARDDGMELWVAEADGEIVSAGRLRPRTPAPSSSARAW